MEFPDLPADFNSGVSIVMIIDSIKKGLINARLNKDWDERYNLLVEYWMQLSSLAKPKHKEENDKIWAECKLALKQLKEAVAKKERSVPTAWFEVFDTWQEFLAQTQQDTGCGMPRSDPRFVMGK